MDELFHKALVIGDLHFGRSVNSPQANKDNLSFLEWAIDAAREWGATHCIMLGDWFDNRHSTGNESMHCALRGIEMISAGFKKSWFISGNHDQFYKDRRDITSIEFAKHIPNIVLINDPLTVEDVTFLPWLVGDEHKTLNLTSRYVFAHLELPGFLLNNKMIMPESAHTTDAGIFSKQDAVYTGHYHHRQFGTGAKSNICYIGNCMGFNFSDDGDADRGMMLLQWGHDPIFKSWPNQPLYRSIKLSELLDNTNILKPEMTLRVTVDLPLQYEEAQEMREELITAYNLRKVELDHNREENDQEFDNNVEFQTIDQLVIAGLESIDSTGLSKERLIEIYRNL